MTIPTNCPACSATEATPHQVFGVLVCASCGCVHTEHPITLGDSFRIVSPRWHEGPDEPDQWRAFDLDVVSSKGRERRHGWFHLGTRDITQVG